jgi:hypothetical protein
VQQIEQNERGSDELQLIFDKKMDLLDYQLKQHRPGGNFS